MLTRVRAPEVRNRERVQKGVDRVPPIGERDDRAAPHHGVDLAHEADVIQMPGKPRVVEHLLRGQVAPVAVR